MGKTVQRAMVAVLGVLVASAMPASAQEAPGGPEVVVPTDVPTDSRPVTGNFNGYGRDTIFWYSPRAGSA